MNIQERIFAAGILFVLLEIVVIIIIRSIMGCIASSIANRRGLKDKGFGWGFLLGIIGIIVMRCCPRDKDDI